MYNEELNTEWINRLTEHVQGKNILLLGNSLSLFADKTGDFIDSYDVVIRVGKGLPYPEFKEYLGSKFDIWSFGVLRSGAIHQVTAPFKIFNFAQVHFYNKKDMLVTPAFMYNERFQVYRDYFLIGSLKDLRSYLRFFPKDSDRISQGILTLLFLLDKIKGYKDITLYGFDFFESHLNFKMKDGDKKAYSWHIPNTKTGATMPHSNALEKPFVNKLIRQKLINYVPCPVGSVDKYVLETLIQKFRPEAVKKE